jgi:hypothetical protein
MRRDYRSRVEMSLRRQDKKKPVGKTSGATTGDHGSLSGLSDPDHPVGALNFSATDKLAGRSAAGGGAGQEISCTAAGRALLDDADAAAQRNTLGIGTGITADVAVAKVGGGTRTLHFTNGVYTGHTDS